MADKLLVHLLEKYKSQMNLFFMPWEDNWKNIHKTEYRRSPRDIQTVLALTITGTTAKPITENMNQAIKNDCQYLWLFLEYPSRTDWRTQEEIDKEREEKSEADYQRLKKEIEDRAYGKPN